MDCVSEIKNRIISILTQSQQTQLLEGIDSLNYTQLQRFLDDIQRFSGDFFQKQQISFQEGIKVSKDLIPYDSYHKPTFETEIEGKNQISKGKVGCLILAGGQGSRFQSHLPKALTPITLVRKKSLLQLICEKINAASQAYQTLLSAAIMVTSSHYEIIQDYLEKNSYFGLSSFQLSLFAQEEVPFLDFKGQWILEQPGILSKGPDGNGYAFRYLFSSGIGKRWQNQGIESVNIIPIDNPLADPFDPHLCGYHYQSRHGVTLKAILNDSSLEKVGVLIKKKQKLGIQEYSELSECLSSVLVHTGLFCFDLNTVSEILSYELPWHLAQKSYHNQMVWKFEKFLFDLLDYIDSSGVIVFPRQDIYAPLKNRTGNNSLETVQQSILDFDYRLLSRLIDVPKPFCLELDPAFYYQNLAPDMKTLESGYIQPKKLG